MSVKRRIRVYLLPLLLALAVSGCGDHAETPVIKERQPAAVAVNSIVPVRTGGNSAQGELLLIPETALFRNGEMTGVLVVGKDQRISQRWIRTGRSLNGDVVVLGGVDKGELVVGEYNPGLLEGVTVIKSPNVTEEVQSK
ncbi:MAG: hypothetical protein HGB23_06520 [Chlorobiaceae bacterium]|nr:hypothetical protein [Chlorobiaceae bacterium]